MFPAPRYTVRKKILKLLGGAFHVWDDAGNLAAFSEQKAFKLKEDIKVFADEAKSRELLSIKARNIIDFSAAYDVVDATSGERVGALRRCGGKSLFRDEWHVLDSADNKIAVVIEDSLVLALIRRLLTGLVPQRYDAFMPDERTGQRVADLNQAFNPFVYRLEVDFSHSTPQQFDRRLGIAAGILLAAIEGREG